MSDTPVGIYTIGQTPRLDLTAGLASRLASFRLELRGALDGLHPDEIPACRPGGYPLETRLRDGTRIVADADFLQPRLQEGIAELDADVRAHLVLCAGPFPLLTAGRPLFRPFDIAANEMSAHGHQSLELLVPFAAQAAPAARKWEAAGFSCRVHTLAERPEEQPVAHWFADRLADASADAVMFDYVGFPPAILDEVREEIGTPVFDAGHLAIDELERTLRPTTNATEDRGTER
jgi:protein AroM